MHATTVDEPYDREMRRLSFSESADLVSRQRGPHAHRGLIAFRQRSPPQISEAHKGRWPHRRAPALPATGRSFQPETPGQRTDKTAKTPFCQFCQWRGGASPRPSRATTRPCGGEPTRERVSRFVLIQVAPRNSEPTANHRFSRPTQLLQHLGTWASRS